MRARFGVDVHDGYGLTEASPVVTTSAVSATPRAGSVGPPLPGVEVRLVDTDGNDVLEGDPGEILVRGPNVFAGYWRDPEATARVLADGWLHTGDIGEVDADGFLRITDRKKDLFKTSGGKYIAPSAIESQFKAICPYASQFLVHGAERNFVVALITLDPDAMEGWAAENGMAGSSYADVVGSQQVKDMVGGYVETLNGRLNRWETIKKWILLDHDLTVESGELTPSLKVKRKVVEDNYKSDIERLYT
jgi:long-chain acyl-CoA synthetase